MKFIELHERHALYLVNVATIGKVKRLEDGRALITFAGTIFAMETDESYEQVKALIYGGVSE